MKLKMFFGALVLSVGMCTQSFGFELLDRMLGMGAYRSHGELKHVARRDRYRNCRRKRHRPRAAISAATVARS